ncbi:MAG TPA: glycosyltransferase [Planctomycetes bacterium]|nr:glycosyltransferase [Planctomycetota bacterium]
MKRSDRPLRVLFCQPTARRTGSEHSLLQILRSLDRARIEPVLLLGEHGPMEEPLAEEVREVHVVPAPKLRRSAATGARFAASFPRLVLAVRRLARRHALDAIHVNTLMFPQATFAGRAAGLGVVSHIREVESTYPRSVYRGYMRWCALQSHHIICVCSAILAQDLPMRARIEARSSVVYNASDHTPTTPRPLREAPEFVSILAATRKKGVLDLVDAYALLRMSHPELRFSATIVGGPGESETRAEAIRRLHAAGLGDSVRFAGEQADVSPFLARADLLVHPSHTEAFPRVLVEAANHALPCVATDVGGSREAVEEGKTGLLVPPRNPAALARGLERIATDRTLHASMAASALERYQGHFTPAIMARGIEQALFAAADRAR